MSNIDLINKLHQEGALDFDEFKRLLKTFDQNDFDYAKKIAAKITEQIFKNKIYIRGLIEISSYCKNDCYYCGLRRSNKLALRYRLNLEEILLCCKEGYRLGFRTFVLQGGEDEYYQDERMVEIIEKIKELYPDCAITLSLGEKVKKLIKSILMQVLIVICFVMKLIIESITISFILMRCHLIIELTVF